jgi:hypothetical protein
VYGLNLYRFAEDTAGKNFCDQISGAEHFGLADVYFLFAGPSIDGLHGAPELNGRDAEV